MDYCMETMLHPVDGTDGHSREDERFAATNLKMRSEAFQEEFELGLPPVKHEAIEAATTAILEAIGEDPSREGLLRTPNRVGRMYDELTSGYRTDPAQLINNALFTVDYSDMVIVKNIEFYSLCEHHMLPFMGHVHVAYIPKGTVIGLSKIPRIVDMFARRLQVQERMTRQIADFVCQVLDPLGVAVVAEGMHMCAMMRGVKKSDVTMTTSAMCGVFQTNSATRAEFMAHLERPGSHL
jgi:GTP cyclohydrolase I